MSESLESQWPAAEVSLRPLGELTPHAQNSRTHSKAQIEQLAKSIREWGFTVPVLVDEAGVIIAGHARVMASQAIGLARVPVMVARGWSETQKRAYIIADNQLPTLATWDEAKLAAELRTLTDLNFDTSLMGFSDSDLAKLIATSDASDEPDVSDDDADALPSGLPVKVSQAGDVWILGKHRLICGDATDPAVVAALMLEERAHLCFTSPPYASQRNYRGTSSDWLGLMCGVFGQLPMRDDGQVLVNLGLVHDEGELVPYWDEWIAWMRAQHWRRFGWYVWDQGPGMPGDWVGRFAPAFEFIFHFNREKRKPNKFVPCARAGDIHTGDAGMRNADGTIQGYGSRGQPIQDTKIPDAVVRIMRHKGAIGEGIDHPAVFPVALPQFMLDAFTSPGEILYEPFCGSGTALIAAQRTHRVARACELAGEYCDVAVIRFRACFREVDIHLEATGQRFDEVMKERTGFGVEFSSTPEKF